MRRGPIGSRDGGASHRLAALIIWYGSPGSTEDYHCLPAYLCLLRRSTFYPQEVAAVRLYPISSNHSIVTLPPHSVTLALRDTGYRNLPIKTIETRKFGSSEYEFDTSFRMSSRTNVEIPQKKCVNFSTDIFTTYICLVKSRWSPRA